MVVLNLTLAYYYTNAPSVLFCSVQCQCQPTNSSNLCSLTNTLKAACRSYSTTHYIKCVFFGSSTAAASICNACHPFFKETSLYTPMIRLRSLVKNATKMKKNYNVKWNLNFSIGVLHCNQLKLHMLYLVSWNKKTCRDWSGRLN